MTKTPHESLNARGRRHQMRVACLNNLSEIPRSHSVGVQLLIGLQPRWPRPHSNQSKDLDWDWNRTYAGAAIKVASWIQHIHDGTAYEG